MKFFLDENETEAILPPLRTVFFDHEFVPASSLGTVGLDDQDLFPAVAEGGFDALITRDRNQLANPAERHSLHENGLHWIGHREPGCRGLLLIASITASYVAALPYIIEAMTSATEPTAFHVKNLGTQPGQRYRAHPLKQR